MIVLTTETRNQTSNWSSEHLNPNQLPWFHGSCACNVGILRSKFYTAMKQREIHTMTDPVKDQRCSSLCDHLVGCWVSFGEDISRVSCPSTNGKTSSILLVIDRSFKTKDLQVRRHIVQPPRGSRLPQFNLHNTLAKHGVPTSYDAQVRKFWGSYLDQSVRLLIKIIN